MYWCMSNEMPCMSTPNIRSQGSLADSIMAKQLKISRGRQTQNYIFSNDYQTVRILLFLSCICIIYVCGKLYDCAFDNFNNNQLLNASKGSHMMSIPNNHMQDSGVFLNLKGSTYDGWTCENIIYVS